MAFSDYPFIFQRPASPPKRLSSARFPGAGSPPYVFQIPFEFQSLMPRARKEKKIFVLDTSVILYDHNAIKNFQEHDVAIPITVLEELDNFKKGNDTKNFEAREFIRFIDQLSGEHMLQEWIPLDGEKRGSFKVLMNTRSELDAEKGVR
jgi:hypothetical protein